jgi:hypothetical protein
MSKEKPPVTYRNYPAYLWQIITDKTGTRFQTLTGRLETNGPWGVRVWRCPPTGKIELVYFIQDGNGRLSVNDMTKKLEFLATDKDWNPIIVPIEGYVHPADCPDSTVVNINEVQVATLKQSINTAQTQANNAYANAEQAKSIANNANAQVASLQKTVKELQAQVNTLQAQVNSLLTPNQVADLVWQKIKDINYLYRLGFLAWPKPDPDADIKAYVDDLVTLIKKAK